MTRTELILKLIVEYFTKTAEPVGSQTLLEKFKLPYSSATIRAEMNQLEKDGFLEKTHTSSGRVPSGKGYTYYVEKLRGDTVDNQVKFALQKVLDAKTKSVEEVMKESCEILSNMTNLASVVLGSKVNEEKLVSVQIVPLSDKSATAVFITDKGYVENKTFIIPDDIAMDEVVKTVTLLNDRLKGTAISEIVLKMEAMKPALTDYIVEHDVVYQAILEAFAKFAGERAKLYGKDNLFEAPEFKEDTKKLQKILQLVDDPTALRKVVESAKSNDDSGVSVSINDQDNGLDDMSVLSAEVDIPGGKKTSISLLGPSRIDYTKAVGILDYVAKALGDYFSGNLPDEEGDEEECQKTKSSKKSKNQA